MWKSKAVYYFRFTAIIALLIYPLFLILDMKKVKGFVNIATKQQEISKNTILKLTVI